MPHGRGVFRWLAVIAVVAALGLVVVFAVSDGDHRADLALELGKGLIQLLAIVVFGGALKLLTDRYQAQQNRVEQERQVRQDIAEQNRRFRQDKYDRLVAATNALRKVPILVDANRSVKTWSEQMLAVIDAGLELRMIKHQIYSSREVDDPPFPDHAVLTYLLESMDHYTDWVTTDFADRKKALSDLQSEAGEHDSADQRARRELAVWNAIQALPSMTDMLSDASDEELDEERTRCRTAIEAELKLLAASGGGRRTRPDVTPSWIRYEEAESLALEHITRTTLKEGQLDTAHVSTRTTGDSVLPDATRHEPSLSSLLPQHQTTPVER